MVKKILSRLFRVFVHVYIHHFDRIAQLGSEAHVNTCYKHFYYFVTEFGLIDTKELEPLVSASGHRGEASAPCPGAACPSGRGRAGHCLQLPPLSGGRNRWTSGDCPPLHLLHPPLSPAGGEQGFFWF